MTCDTACNGADAGEYYYFSGMTSSYDKHPVDGHGGSISATDSRITIRKTACQKGTKWDSQEVGTKSVYRDSSFLGGTFSGGTVYGDVITIDLLSVLSGTFSYQTDIRNSEEASAAKCTINTQKELAGKEVMVSSNSLKRSAVLNGNGQLVTYLAVGKNLVKIEGEGIYTGTLMVKRSASLNVFTLDPYGIINVTYDGAIIQENQYEYTNETYEYDGDFTDRKSVV